MGYGIHFGHDSLTDWLTDSRHFLSGTVYLFFWWCVRHGVTDWARTWAACLVCPCPPASTRRHFSSCKKVQFHWDKPVQRQYIFKKSHLSCLLSLNYILSTVDLQCILGYTIWPNGLFLQTLRSISIFFDILRGVCFLPL